MESRIYWQHLMNVETKIKTYVMIFYQWEETDIAASNNVLQYLRIRYYLSCLCDITLWANNNRLPFSYCVLSFFMIVLSLFFALPDDQPISIVGVALGLSKLDEKMLCVYTVSLPCQKKNVLAKKFNEPLKTCHCPFFPINCILF